jgi:integrase
MLTKPYPKDNEARTMALPADLVAQLTDAITTRHLGPNDLLFATRDGTPISGNTFRARIWMPAIEASGVNFDVRVHDLRHAHASWLASADRQRYSSKTTEWGKRAATAPRSCLPG